MKNKEEFIRKDLTFDEFEALANRQPDLEGEWIYKLEQTELGDVPENPYPKFEVDMTYTFYFRSFEEAERFIRDHQGEVRLYRSVITQIPVGHHHWEMGACWLYDGDGKLIDYSITTDQEDKPYNACFFGRPDSRQRFKKGDIVEIFDGKHVSLALLISNPPDVNWCWQMYQRCLKEVRHGWYYHLDLSDDSGIVLEGPDYGYHSHLSTLALMHPSMPIPADLEAEIRSWDQRSKETPEEESEEISAPERRIRRGERIGDFAALGLSIHYEGDIEVPHIHISDRYGFEASIRMDAPEYYDHDGVSGRLSDSQVDALVDYLSEFESGKIRWWYMIRDWNVDECSTPIPLTLPLPDYRQLKSAK